MKSLLHKFIVLTSLLMYVGTAHGMMFLMQMDTASEHHHSSVECGEACKNLLISNSSHMTHDSSADMQACIDHCIASVVMIPYVFSTQALLQQTEKIPGPNLAIYSLTAEIHSPPPKYLLI